MFPPSESVIRHPLPSLGSRRWRFSDFHGTTRCSESLRTVTAGFLVVDLPLPLPLRLCFVSPFRSDADQRARDVRVRPSLRRFRVESQGVPSSWRTLVCLCPVLRPRPDRARLALTACRCCPRSVQYEGSSGYYSRGSIARLWHWLSTLRPVGCPHQGARLASGCWLGFTGWDWRPTGSLRKVSKV
jgi:hypothetical protein